MSVSDLPIFANTPTNVDNYKVGEPEFEPKSYRCHLALIQEEGGGFSAVVLNLPGAGSCGGTTDEAVLNCREAIVGVLESYWSACEEIPWLDNTEYKIPEGSQQKWILVDA